MTILFSSVHQTWVHTSVSNTGLDINSLWFRVTIMVWVTYYLALRPDCQAALRDEINSLSDSTNNEYNASKIGYLELRKAALADSFIREVLRMKGDSVNVVRSSIRDVELGGYTIPKGIHQGPRRLILASADKIRLHYISLYPSIISISGFYPRSG